MNHEFDVVVVGAGPAGIAAAALAAEHGQRVGILDDNPGLGGQIWRGDAQESPAAKWRRTRLVGRNDSAGLARVSSTQTRHSSRGAARCFV